MSNTDRRQYIDRCTYILYENSFILSIFMRNILPLFSHLSLYIEQRKLVQQVGQVSKREHRKKMRDEEKNGLCHALIWPFHCSQSRHLWEKKGERERASIYRIRSCRRIFSLVAIRYAMAEIIFVVIGVTAGAGLILGSIITTFCCYKRYYRHPAPPPRQVSKQRQDNDYLHSVIINQHIARHLRPQSSISIVSNDYHHDMTLMAPPRRLALLEQQQQQPRHQEPGTLIIENPLVSRPVAPTIELLSSSFVYENPSLELGEFSTINAGHV